MEREREQGVCVSSSSARIPGIDPFPNWRQPFSPWQNFFPSSPSIHPPTQNKKVKKSMRIKVGLFFPILFFLLDTEKRETHFPFSLRFAVECRGAMMAAQHLQWWINDWKTWWCRSIKSYTIPSWWMIIPTERKRRKNEFSRLSPSVAFWDSREFCDIYRDMQSHIRERIIATLENT